MKYKLTPGGIKDTERNMWIPNSDGNRHWREYQEWLDEGNEPEPEFTAEELEAKEAAEAIAALHEDLRHTDWALLKIFIRLYQVLAGKGLITKADIGNAYVDGILELKAKLDVIENA